METELKSYLAGCYAISEPGLVRTNNEDALLVLPEAGIFAVSDGRGGASAGEVASKIITERLRALEDTAQESPGERKYLVQQTLHKVNAEIAKYAAGHNYSSMGATLVVLLLNPWDPVKADICNAGDSRGYCYRDGELFLLTEDHVLSDDPKQRHILTNYLGGKNSMSAAWNPVSVCPGDRFVLCSDGLTSVIPEATIREILAEERDPEKTVCSLSEKIRAAGAPDNYTIICIDIAAELPGKAAVSEEDRKESEYLYGIAERRKDYGRQ